METISTSTNAGNWVGTSTDCTTWTGYYQEVEDDDEIKITKEGDEIVIRIKRKKPEQKIVYVPYYIPYTPQPIYPWFQEPTITWCSTP